MRFNFTAMSFRFAIQYQREMSGKVLLGSAPRVAPQRSRLEPGGSISRTLLSTALRRVGPWGFSILMSRLPDYYGFWHHGTRRQIPRPIDTPLPVKAFMLRAQEEAAKQLRRRDQGAV